MKLVSISMSRYNGGVGAKRRYGSSTITKFAVFRDVDRDIWRRHVYVDVGGKTPSERSTNAKTAAEPVIRELLKKEGIDD